MTLIQEVQPDTTITYLYEADSFVPLAQVHSDMADSAYAPQAVEARKQAAAAEAQEALDETEKLKWLEVTDRKAHALAVETIAARREKAERDDFLQRERQGQEDWIYYVNTDHLGTPQEVVSEDGNVVWLARYRAWGRIHQLDKSEIRQPFRFQGQYEDAETGLYYNRHRYYDPDTARFLTQDPIGLAGGMNGYQYAPNPTGWSDPLGLQVRPGGACVHDSGKHGELSPDKNRAPDNRNIREDSFVQSHHPVQNEWAEKNIPGYDKNQAPTVLLRSASGESHAKISAAQRAQRRSLDGQSGGRWGSTTVTDEFNTGYRQMTDAGVPQDTARRAMKKSYKYFDCLGAFK